MTTKQRFRNKYRLEIREDDHPPMHAHLVGGNLDVMINLQTLTYIGSFPLNLRDELIEEWKNGIHETSTLISG